LKEINSEKIIGLLFDKVGPVFKDVVGGYLTLQRLQQRVADGATMVKVAWAKPVVLVEPVVVETKDTKTKTKALVEPKAVKTAKKVKAPKK
jgi:hypothetical protein